MLNNKKYLIIVIILSFVPVILFHISLISLWNGDVKSSTNAATYSFLFTSFFIPIYVVFINYFLSLKFKIFNFIFNYIIVLISIFLSSYLTIYNWESSTGLSFESDNEGGGVINLERIIAIAISTIELLIIYLNRWRFPDIKR